MENKPYFQEEQISTRDFLLKIVDFFQAIGKGWRLLLIGLATGALIGVIRDVVTQKEPVYTSTLVFNLDIGGTQNGNAGLGGLASVFGMGGMQQAQGGDLFSGANFPALVQSRAVYERALMTDVVVDGKKMLMANYFKDSSDIVKTIWAGSLVRSPYTSAINYRFTKKSQDTFTKEENEIISSIYDYLVEKTVILQLNGTSFSQIEVATTNEMLSKIWAETLLKATEGFYKEMKTRKTREMLAIQERRLDSLQNLMFSTDRRMAQLTFQSQNVVDPIGPMRQQQVTRNNQFYSTQYYAQLNNVEALQRTLIEQTPIFTVIEPIRLPLETTRVGVGQSLRLGSLLGFFLCLAIVIARHLYQQIMD